MAVVGRLAALHAPSRIPLDLTFVADGRRSHHKGTMHEREAHMHGYGEGGRAMRTAWLAVLALAGTLASAEPAAATGAGAMPAAVQRDAARQGQPGRAPDLGDGPATLSRIVAVALERNRDILDAGYQVALAGGQVSEAWSGLYPSLEFSGSFTRNVAPQVSFLPAQIFDPNAAEGDFIPVQFAGDNLWNLSVDAEQSLLDPDIFAGVGAAGRYRGLQREALRGRTQQVVTRVRIAFYDLLLAQEDVRLATNSLERVRQSLEETRAMVDAGLAAEYDELRLEVELANLEPTLGRARNRLTANRRALATELDMDSEAELVVAGDLARIDLEDLAANSPANRDILNFAGAREGLIAPTEGAQPAPELVAAGIGFRSDVLQLEITESLRQAELRVEQAGYLPTVTAFGHYGLAAQQNGSPDFFGTSMQRGSTKQLGLRVSFPIFSGFSRNARIAQRRAALRQAEIQTRVASDRAEVELRNLADQVREAGARAAGQRKAVAQARRGYEIASAQYAEGVSSQLERTDAEVALRQSEFNYAQAVYDYLAARARLDEASGRVPMVDVAGPSGSGAR